MITKKPTPQLKVGDVIIWRGRRDNGTLSDWVYDWIVEVFVERVGERHEIRYRTQKQYGFYESELAPPLRSGYVNFAGRLGQPGLHSGRLEVDLHFRPEEFPPVAERLIQAGFPIHPRVGKLYPLAQALQYSRTWTREREKIKVKRLTPEVAGVLAFVSRDLSDEECLAFIGGYDVRNRRPYPNLDRAFEYNPYMDWYGLANYSLSQAVDLLVRASDVELIGQVRAYRQALLSGEATYHYSGTLEKLFPLDWTKATGSWPKPVLAWAKAQKIRGSGKTRLHRVYEAATDPKGMIEMTLEPSDYLTVWTNKKVIAVTAGKGGVGKSTIAADLARALARSGQKVMLADFDVSGPSQHIFFPLPGDGLRVEDGLMVPPIVDGVQVMTTGYFLKKGEAMTWRGSYLASLLHLATLYTKIEADVIVIDMPPGTSDVLRHLQNIVPTAYWIFVATASSVADPDLRRAIGALAGGQRERIVGMVNNMAHVNGQPMWGSLDSVPQLAQDYHLRYLGALPFVFWQEDGGHEEARILATAELLLPAIRQYVLDVEIPYQEVDPAVIVEAADGLIERIKESRRYQGVTALWGIDNIGSFLAAPIARAGGNPNDPRYRPVLLEQLARTWGEYGNTVLTFAQRSDTLDSTAWWYEVAVTELAKEDNKNGHSS